MGKFLCHCGTTILTSGQIPNPGAWKILSDGLFDEFTGVIDSETIYRAATSAYTCAECGRLWIYADGVTGEPSSYLPERMP
jgi:hypothetical protein